jgi:nitrogen fixation protein NifU and related proteins
MEMMNLLVGAGVLLVIVLLWFLLSYFLTPHVESPSGEARLTGSCGDTMQISLKFHNDRVAATSYWTNGCAYSFNCIYVASELAKGKSPDEILKIDPELIREAVGGLPGDQMHCARLSVETLHAALDDFMRKQTSSHSQA